MAARRLDAQDWHYVLASRATSEAQVSSEYRAIICLDLSPICISSASSNALTRCKRAVNSSSRPGSNTKPLLSCSTRSSTQPQRLETITGRLEAIASFTTSPHGSDTLAKTKHL